MQYVLKATLCPECVFTDGGFLIGKQQYHYDEISDVHLFSKATALTNGVIQMNVGGKLVKATFPVKQKEEGMAVYDFLQKAVAENKAQGETTAPGQEEKYPSYIKNKHSFSNVTNVSANSDTAQLKLKDRYLTEALAAARSVLSPDEHILVALKGAFKEYLICTDTSVHIIKKGFMTGHTFGNGDFKMPYANVTNAEVDYHMMSGYFELSSGGLQNRRYNYWSSDAKDDPAKQPNVISLNNKQAADLFRQAANFIMEKSAEAKQPQTVSVQKESTVSAADEIKKFKELLDMGAISQEEYEAKKKQLLGL